MFYLAQVLIGRSVVSLDRPFTYYTDDETIKAGHRVLVSFGPSKSTTGFVLKDLEKIDLSLEEYQAKNNIKLSKIIRKIDDEPLLSKQLLELAYKMSSYYKADLINVLSSFLPPSLKPKDSALHKPQKKTVSFAFALDKDDDTLPLTKHENELYKKIKVEADGIRTVHITAKASLKNLIEKGLVEIKEIPVSRIPELQAKKLLPYELTLSQKEAYKKIEQSEKNIILLQGVTGSGKTHIYIKLAQEYLKQGQGVLILVPEIALNDSFANVFASYFGDTLSILNSSLSDARKYDEYQRIYSGETKVVLGTRSAIFAPVNNLGLIIIDEEHSSSYKQDSSPFYDAIKVASFRSEIENVKVVLGSATPRIIDRARADKGIYELVKLDTRFSSYQEHDLKVVDMNNSAIFNANISSLFSSQLVEEIKKNLENKEQTMILINRRGYSPIYLCRACHSAAKCPNCDIPLNYHKKDNTLRCHHCGYKSQIYDYKCPKCGCNDFLTLGYGTERAYEELKFLFPNARINRLDSDVSSNEVRHEVLEGFSTGEYDILIGTEVIAKGHNFPKVTLAAILDSDFSLKLPTYLANEQTFDLISQFVGRAGRADKKGRIVLQTYVPDNKVIKFAAKQDYQSFYEYEMEERKKYQYPPYTYLASITIKATEKKRSYIVGDLLANYLEKECRHKRINFYGPSDPYIPHINGRYFRNILIKYKSIDEISPILDGIKTIRLANKDVEIYINIDPETESI